MWFLRGCLGDSLVILISPKQNTKQANKTFRRLKMRQGINPKPKTFILKLKKSQINWVPADYSLFCHCNSQSTVATQTPSQLDTLQVGFPPLIYLCIWFPLRIHGAIAHFLTCVDPWSLLLKDSLATVVRLSWGSSVHLIRDFLFQFASWKRVSRMSHQSMWVR